jgi:hypothetical protein
LNTTVNFWGSIHERPKEPSFGQTMKTIGTLFESQKLKKQNLIKKFFHQMKRFEDKYLVDPPLRLSQEASEKSKERKSGSPPTTSTATAGKRSPLQLKLSINPKIIDFTYNLSKDTKIMSE